MKFITIFSSLALAGLGLAQANKTPLRNVIYFDQYHKAILPHKKETSGITHVIMAFANSSLFADKTAGEYKPFMPINDVRAMFDNGTQIGIALGGWGDTAGFTSGAMTPASRKKYAHNVAKMVNKLGFDFVDIDWEYPGGNGADYKENPNGNKTTEITTFPLFLHAIKDAIAPKHLSVAVPAMQRDMITYTKHQAPHIFSAVDMVNVMAYDMVNRRDTVTAHHSSVKGALDTIQQYLDLGLEPAKVNLGFAYYAKFFQTAPGVTCTKPTGCHIIAAENEDGSDSGTSGTMTFEKANVHPLPVPKELQATTNGSCGAGTSFTCGSGCCSQYGFCGASAEYCALGCQTAYSGPGACSGPDLVDAFRKALAHGVLDEKEGGMWYWDPDTKFFWTWDTPALMQRKMHEIVGAKGLGGVMAWSLGEDSAGWTHIQTVSHAVKKMVLPSGTEKKRSLKKVRGRLERPHGHQWAH
ncbi:glycoside hydrolase family 18 protein [Hypoxylon sp. CI-4A]|nr:glycoside hydrolase family 18 protein [Hypoxylon sp. CI-4A]